MKQLFFHISGLLGLLFLTSINQYGQKVVEFPSEDGLTVTADLYEGRAGDPYIILMHQAGSSRGEYREIAPRLVKMGFSCLAVDLRSGNEMNYIPNETARLAKATGVTADFLSTRQDIRSAIRYAWNQNHKKVILFGSSYSASLSLVEGCTNDSVRAIIAFSPGEYFEHTLSVASFAGKLDKPTFIYATSREYPYVVRMMTTAGKNKLTIVKPSAGEGHHGARALYEANAESHEVWLALMVYFQNLIKK